MAATSIKTSDGGFSKTGAGWGSVTGVYSASAWTNSSNSAAQFATFGFTGLTGGVKVMVALTCPTSGSRAAATPWQILDSDGSTVLTSGTVNQRQEMLMLTYDGVTWRWLAAVTPTGTTLTLKILCNGGSGSVAVDGAYLQLASDAFDPATIASGNLSSGSTWINGTVPSNGTKAVIQHPVTVDTNTTIGTSGATGTTAITILGANTGGTGTGGSLTVADGVTLTVRGDIILTCKDSAREASYFPLQIGTGSTGGASLVFDASQATTPLSQTYVCGPTANSQVNAQVKIRGTSDNFASVSSNASGGNGYFSLRSFVGQLGQVDAQYVNFTRIGDSTNPAFTSSLSGGPTTNTFSLKNYTFTSCGKISHPGNIASNTAFILNDGLHTSTLTDCCVHIFTGTNAIGTGTREIKRCAFDKRLGSPSTGGTFRDFTIQHVLCEDGYATSDSSTGFAWSLFDNCVVRKDFQDPKCAGNMSNTYFLDNISNNPHFLGLSQFYDCIIDGLIFEHGAGSSGPNDGDGVFPAASPASARLYTVKNSLSLPRANDSTYPSCNIVSCLTSSSNVKFDVYHNTFMLSATADHGTQINETSATPAGAIQNYKSNLGWDLSARGNHFQTVSRSAGASVNDVLVAGSATNNCAYNALATPSGAQSECSAGYGNSVGTYYRTPTTVGTPGANDVNVNPGFVDTSRNFAKWATTQSLSASAANTLIALRSDLATKIPALLAWVRGGFAPTNSSIKNAGHDGITIGAVEWVASSTAPTVFGDIDGFGFYSGTDTIYF